MNNLAKVDEYKAVATGLIDLGIQYGLSLVSAIGILIAGFFLAGWASRAIRRRLEKLKRFDQTL
ncbi:MAG TPA: hypothetical protein ENH27_05255, partial [Rhizobiales bacterium]|nr:hypothetical protein [Hyphomicrobiales bacterium]